MIYVPNRDRLTRIMGSNILINTPIKVNDKMIASLAVIENLLGSLCLMVNSCQKLKKKQLLALLQAGYMTPFKSDSYKRGVAERLQG
jgi:hypothetical protein